MKTELVQSWGRIQRIPQQVYYPRSLGEARAALAAASAANASITPYGLGRSYGDSCLNHRGRLISVTGLDRLISFDRQSGVLRSEAGVSLADVLAVCVPAGWFLPVTPGSRFVTLGGAVANDVHGKNHHVAGTFGSHVQALGLIRSDGAEYTLGPGDGLFCAAVGGLGLTGLISWVEFQLMPIESAYLEVEQQTFSGFDEFLSLSEASEPDWPHTVAWLDCVNRFPAGPRGIFMRGRFCRDGDLNGRRSSRNFSVPLELPGFTLNRATVSAFNRWFFHRQRRRRNQRQHFEPFFYPLDRIGNWNRIYGPRGFYQHQFVVPHESAASCLAEVLDAVLEVGQASFLSVLKCFGDRPSPGLMSFPIPGVTLAMDFRNRGDSTLVLLEKLDQIVRAGGGRIYPAKDGRVSGTTFRAMYPEHSEFSDWIDPMFSSSFWQRVAHD